MIGTTLDVPEYLQRLSQELGQLDCAQIRSFSDVVFRCYEQGRFVFLCGNGGSGSNASHFCEDLGKGTLRREDYSDDAKKRLKVVSLTDNTAYIMAWANDEGYERIFVEQLKNLAAPDDLLVALSGSGNSPNVLRAVEWAVQHDLHTFALTGFDGGKLRGIAHQGLHVSLHDMGMVESIHLAVFHWVLDNLYTRISGR